MIRSGKLRYVITVQRASGVTQNEYGTEVPAWADLATLRAELLPGAAREDQSAEPGTRGRAVITLRTRYFDGLTVDDRVQFKGAPYDIKELTEIAPQRGLELLCEGAA